jgi:glycosyltransferase involved in cell wall biosynthesis
VKRILFLDHTLIIGGGQLALWDHMRHLDRTRFEAQVLCSATVPALIEQLRSQGIRTHLLDWPRLRRPTPMTFANALRAGLRLRKIIRDENIDLVVANTTRTAYTAAAAMIDSPIPLIWWVRDFDYGRRWFRAFGRIPRRIICVSNALRDYYGGGHDPKYAVVYVGNDLHEKLAAYPPDQVQSARTRCGFDADDVVVGFMGRLVEGKGPEDLVDAVAQLRTEFPKLRLAIVGTGEGQLGGVEQRMRQRVIEMGLSDIVHFAGYRSEEGLYYQMFDVFVLSSRYQEAMATSVIQAMMARTPVVATRTGGTPEIVRDGETGILVPPSDPRALADGLRRLLRDPAAAKRMSLAAYEHVMAHHRQDAVTRQVEDVYESVLRTTRAETALDLAVADAER